MADENKRYKCKFINLERKGESHMFSSNGEIFHIKHGAVTDLPLHAINALKDAVKIEWKMLDMNRETGRPKKYEDPRFHVEVLEEIDAREKMAPEQQKQEELIGDILAVQQGK
jgi:hypothetical protein